MHAHGLPEVPGPIRRCRALPNVDGQDKDWMYTYWDRDGELLYVGLSNDPALRANGHRCGSRWWRFVASGEAWMVDLRLSGRLEKDTIRDFEPLFNIQYAGHDWRLMVEYCARREAWDLVDEITDMFWAEPSAA